MRSVRCPGCPNQHSPCISSAGNTDQPLIAFVGEAPGRHEAQKGIPFVGPSGQLLKQVLAYIGIPKEQCYVTNAIMCHPPENRDPTAQELSACHDRLMTELCEVRPRVVVTLGAVAAKQILGPQATLQKVRGRFHTLQSPYPVDVFSTIHPAVCLYPKGDTQLPTLIRDLQRCWRVITGDPYQNDILFQKHTDVTVITNEDHARQVIIEAFHNHCGILSFDWETTGTDPRRSVGHCLALSLKPGTAIVIPMHVLRETEMPQNLLWDVYIQRSAFNSPFDTQFNGIYGLPTTVAWDPMIMHYLLDERPQRRSLENLSVDYLDADPYETEMLTKYKCTKTDFLQKVPPEVIYEYAGRDADYALRLTLLFKEDLEKEPALLKLWTHLYLRAIPAVVRMQQAGLYVDQKRWAEVLETYRGRAAALTQGLIDYVNGLLDALPESPKPFLTHHKVPKTKVFNPNSDPMIQCIAWDILKLKEPKLQGRRPRSMDSTTREILLREYPDHPFLSLLDQHSKASTMLSRYLEPLPEHIQSDGRVRCQWHFDRTETGRLAVTNPPLHQQPRDPEIRSIYVAEPGKVLVQLDFSQGEIRWAAHYGQCKSLTEIVNSGKDFHTFMASLAFKVPYDQVTKAQRQAAKEVSFGLLYLMGDSKLAARTGLPPAEAKQFVLDYKALMPGVQEWIKEQRRRVLEVGYVESLWGNRRRFPLVTENNYEDLCREAVNAPIQGGLSHQCLLALIEIDEALQQPYPEARIVFFQHDSIMIECPEPIAQEVARIARDIMEEPPFQTGVLFPVEAKIGKQWGAGELVT